MTPVALRAMRAAVGWSMRDLAEQAEVALASVLKIERGERVSHRLEQRVEATFAARGVKSWRQWGGTVVSILDKAPPTPATPVDELRAMPWVSLRPVSGGRHKVEFLVPSLHRPMRWPSKQSLPLTGPRTGDLADPVELAAIKRDALTLAARLAKMTEEEGSPAALART